MENQKNHHQGQEQLKDNDDMQKINLKGGMTIMMMGAAEGMGLKEPEKPIKFLEEMTPEEKAICPQSRLSRRGPAWPRELG